MRSFIGTALGALFWLCAHPAGATGGLIAAAFVGTQSAAAPPAWVQSCPIAVWGGDSSASDTATVTCSGVKAGDTLIVESLAMSTISTVAVSVSDGSAYTSDVQNSQVASGGTEWVQSGIYHLYNAAAGTHAIVCTNNGGPYAAYGGCTAIEVSGVGTTLPPVTSSNANAGSNNPTTGSVTPATNCSIAVSVLAVSNGANPIIFGYPPAGYTNIGTLLNGQQEGGQFNGGSADYIVLSTAAAQNPSYATFTAAGAWTASIADYPGASCGGSPPPPPPPSGAMKFHPGSYLSSDQYVTTGNINYGGSPAGSLKLAEINIVRNGPAAVLGVEEYYTWQSFEHAGQGNYDFSTSGGGFDADYVAITGYVSGNGPAGTAVYNNPLREIVYLEVSDYFSNNPSARALPSYVTGDSADGPAGPDGQYGYWTIPGIDPSCGGGQCVTGGSTAAFWRASPAFQYSVFLQNGLAPHVLPDGWTVDTSPYIEAIVLFNETAVMSPTGPTDSTFSDGAILTQLANIGAAARAAFPHTQIVMPNNFLSDAPTSQALEQTLPTNALASGGPDTFGYSSNPPYPSPGTVTPNYNPNCGLCGETWGQASYATLTSPGYNNNQWNCCWAGLVGVVPMIGTVQLTELFAPYGAQYTPADIFQQANTVFHDTHIAWQYGVYGLSAFVNGTTVYAPASALWFGSAANQSSWNASTSGGVLAQIVNNPLPTVLPCPSAYTGGCNENAIFILMLPALRRRYRIEVANDDEFDAAEAA